MVGLVATSMRHLYFFPAFYVFYVSVVSQVAHSSASPLCFKFNSFASLRGRQTPLSNSKSEKVKTNVINF